MKYSILELSGTFRETGKMIKSLLSLQGEESFRYDRFLIKVENLLKDEKIKTVIIDVKVNFNLQLFSAVESIRSQLKRLKDAGKEIYFCARYYNSINLYLGSACSKMLIHPLGTVDFLGVSRTFTFFKRLTDKFDVEVDIIRRGKYKSAGDNFRTDELDPFNREQCEAILNSFIKELKEKVIKDLNKTEDDLNKLLDGKILNSEEAQKEGWISEVKTVEDLIYEFYKSKNKEVKFNKNRNSYGKGKRIAVLVFEGAIIDGKSKQDPLIGQAIGSDSYIPFIKKLAKDKSIKGVVFRVNSGGGSAIASEEIVNEIRKLREEKPVVVSMSEIAGSGGYWISTECDKLFAERTTITGSIGVITMFFYAKKLFEKYGITHSTLKIGEHSDLGSTLRKLTEKEQSMINKTIEDIYQMFLNKVSRFRNKSIEEIHNIAQGRVWSGEDALKVGIIDEIGGLVEAINFLKNKLGIENAKVIFYPTIKFNFIERLIYGSSMISTNISKELTEIISVVNKSSLLFKNNGTPMVLMPEYIDLNILWWELKEIIGYY